MKRILFKFISIALAITFLWQQVTLAGMDEAYSLRPRAAAQRIQTSPLKQQEKFLSESTPLVLDGGTCPSNVNIANDIFKNLDPRDEKDLRELLTADAAGMQKLISNSGDRMIVYHAGEFDEYGGHIYYFKLKMPDDGITMLRLENAGPVLNEEGNVTQAKYLYKELAVNDAGEFYANNPDVVPSGTALYADEARRFWAMNELYSLGLMRDRPSGIGLYKDHRFENNQTGFIIMGVRGDDMRLDAIGDRIIARPFNMAASEAIMLDASEEDAIMEQIGRILSQCHRMGFYNLKIGLSDFGITWEDGAFVVKLASVENVTYVPQDATMDHRSNLRFLDIMRLFYNVGSERVTYESATSLLAGYKTTSLSRLGIGFFRGYFHGLISAGGANFDKTYSTYESRKDYIPWIMSLLRAEEAPSKILALTKEPTEIVAAQDASGKELEDLGRFSKLKDELEELKKIRLQVPLNPKDPKYKEAMEALERKNLRIGEKLRQIRKLVFPYIHGENRCADGIIDIVNWAYLEEVPSFDGVRLIGWRDALRFFSIQDRLGSERAFNESAMVPLTEKMIQDLLRVPFTKAKLRKLDAFIDDLLIFNPKICEELLRPGAPKEVAIFVIERLAVWKVAFNVGHKGNLDRYVAVAKENSEIKARAEAIERLGFLRTIEAYFSPILPDFILPCPPNEDKDRIVGLMNTDKSERVDRTLPPRTTMIEMHRNCWQHFMCDKGELVILYQPPRMPYLMAFRLKKGEVITIPPGSWHIAVNGTDNCKFHIFNESIDKPGESVKPEIEFKCLGRNTFVVSETRRAPAGHVEPLHRYPTINILGAI